ncbi:GMC oxidoreductase [Paraliomyxa miuraensis]|uniref:GMC oxidoreductase n=1 Tax=Paraliomyxa miuraensis TaxID=376150 RepID=UPI002255B7F7|nr:GMC family oxidoreductase [Paraliomyxa miuraensis]MCX4247292.1 GMC family oxidoreductase [Paraliomyxa miuraensis]
MPEGFDYDVIIVGSGFGGSPTALRLVEKGYSVLMLEKGSELGPAQFPRSNWNVWRWLWMPWLGARGLFKMTFFRHVTVLSGVGVGGGSLVYASTHPVPNTSFFHTGSWAGLAAWEEELRPHYAEVKRMLGVNPTPMLTPPDKIIKAIAEERGQSEGFHPTDVAIYFGDPGKTVDDPYFDGEGPPRTGCIRCGGCMLGCQHGAKNTLDKNYLWLARKQGLVLQADTEVTAVRPLPPGRGGGYQVEAKHGRHPLWRRRKVYTARRVVLAGGVLGTVELLAKMKRDPRGLPRLSDKLGAAIRTNSESLIGVVTAKRDLDYSKGVAIGSIFEIDEHAHLEPVRYPAGSGAWRLALLPHVTGENGVVRIARMLGTMIRHPLRLLRAMLVPDLAKQSAILLYMRTADGTLRFVRRWWGSLGSQREAGPAPTASIPQATELAHAFGERMGGMPMSLVTETALNIPTTAHILGGCCMGDSIETGVIDAEHRVHGYEGLYVIDGSSISSNPGVNPSLTIAALAERAVARWPSRAEASMADQTAAQ